MDQVRGGKQQGNWRRLAAAAGEDPAALAAVSALALLASFPPLDFWPLAWVALAPLAALLGRRNSDTGRARREATDVDSGRGGFFRHAPEVLRWLGAGWAFGAVFDLGQFSWLGYTLVQQGGVPPVRALVFGAIVVATLACAPALAFGAAAALARLGWPAGLALPLALGALDLALGAFPFGGAPWGSLAGPQAHTLAAGVVAPVLGSAGLVALMGGVNCAWAAWAARWHAGSARGPADRPAGRQRRTRRAALAASGALLAIATLALLAPWSGQIWTRPGEAPGELHALLVPGRLALRDMRAGAGTAASLRYYLARALSALPVPAGGSPGGGNPAGAEPRRTLAILPESAAMEPLTRGRTLADLSRLGTLWNADFLLGADAEDPAGVTNALFLVTGGRFDFARYDKRHLVPFGEYVPAGFGWAFGRKVTAGEQDYAAGKQPPVLDWRGVRVGVAICFESILPGHARDEARAGAEVLAVAANDAWLPPYAQAQHVQLTALRAREVGREALFVSNGGPAARLAQGGVRARTSAAGEPLAVSARLERGWTPWTRWGPWGDGAAAGALLLAAAPWRRRRGALSRGRGAP